MPIMLELPWPPSQNALYRSVPSGKYCRTILSKKGREYYKTVCWGLEWNKPPIDRPVKVWLRLRPPNRRLIDIDNRAKAALDALVHCGVLANDSTQVVRQLLIDYGERVADGAVEVIIFDEGEAT